MAKESKPKEYKAVVCEWKDGTWIKTEQFFKNYGLAQSFARKTKARCKVYDWNGQLVFDNEYDCEHTSPYC